MSIHLSALYQTALRNRINVFIVGTVPYADENSLNLGARRGLKIMSVCVCALLYEIFFCTYMRFCVCIVCHFLMNETLMNIWAFLNIDFFAFFFSSIFLIFKINFFFAFLTQHHFNIMLDNTFRWPPGVPFSFPSSPEIMEHVWNVREY